MGRKAIFIDIDGVVVYDPGYLSKAEELEFLPHALKALKKAQQHGFFLVFISNKGGAFKRKGLTDKGLNYLDREFIKLLVNNGLETKKIATYYCIHYLSDNKKIICSCRKPNPGLFTKAVHDLNISADLSYVIGDKITDLIPGKKIGCAKAILVARNQEVTKLEKGKADAKFRTLSEAIDFIL